MDQSEIFEAMPKIIHLIHTTIKGMLQNALKPPHFLFNNQFSLSETYNSRRNVSVRSKMLNPVRHYLEQVPQSDFDIRSFFETYFGVDTHNEDKHEYVREASRVFLTEACGRRRCRV